MKQALLLAMTLLVCGPAMGQVGFSEMKAGPVASTWSERVHRLQTTTPARIVVQTTLREGQTAFVSIRHEASDQWSVAIAVPKKGTRVYDHLTSSQALPAKAGLGEVSASTLWRWVTGAEPYANVDAVDAMRPDWAGYVHHQVHFSEWAFNPEAGLTMPGVVRVQQTSNHQTVRDQTFRVEMFVLGKP